MNYDKNIRLDVLLRDYSEVWVALAPDETRVVGSGKSVEKALEQAKKNGCDEPILSYVPRHYSAYVL